MHILKSAIAASLVAFAALPAFAQGKSNLDVVKQRGQLICGVNTGLGGFSLADSQGKWKGLDVDMCGAVAAAVLG
ncbi:MAG TPA: amino acid ABC transporter substrate-binding protein, partial [Reyranella sp.]|nr:amino acid ABC transporter substrate-binding protein [Reyranella sp.]